jgi:cytochrome d ubiquinol oxidase subunit I
MDALILARIQFALTIGFHYLYPPLSIGLGVIMVIIETQYLITKKEHYKTMARFWTRVFALTFSIGVATGIVMEFEFGTNWATYSKFVGDIFGSALGAEGIFAFFLESGFLAILIFGWERVGPRLHYFSTWMVCLGAHFSAIWIVVANSWMQTPAGYHLVQHELGLRAEITDFWQMVFNPSSCERLSHTIVGAWLAGAFLVISVAAWYLLKNRHIEFAKDSLKVAVPFASFALFLSLITGHISAIGVAKNQPTKMAAFEGIFNTHPRAGLSMVGWIDHEQQRARGIELPGMLSMMLYNDFNAPVRGLNEFPKDEWPPLQLTFQSYHLMVTMWGMMSTVIMGAWLKRKKLKTLDWTSLDRWGLRIMIGSIAFPMIANQFGWMAAEVGRQPWIVWGLLKTKDGLSKSVTASMIWASLIIFTVIYFLLFILFIFLLDRKIRHGPEAYGSEEYTDSLIHEITSKKDSL